ncbi:hypothetical protein [Halpernia frigidisoli]|uniref:Uncharacterized protein n=1 Tax=Halpernia frigidisoli TaxID=1125876 RepID=A0A1I3FNB6_9FLAO|nr:hypothetical protein [Halpernia frigidisoli]SFI12664.1 hypothetical protein SAMN05443292_1498 [Halpernia frigidisoli]
MKNNIVLLAVLFSISTFSQVAIGKNSTTNSSVSLEFGNANKGVILPWVTSSAATSGAVDGTMIFDIVDKKIKFKSNGSWMDYTTDLTGVVDTKIQNTLQENLTAKVAIGKDNSTDTAPGILVLTDTDKAMILPKVANPYLNIINPSAGMVVYDTVSHQMATFNGTVWSFWKPS